MHHRWPRMAGLDKQDSCYRSHGEAREHSEMKQQQQMTLKKKRKNPSNFVISVSRRQTRCENFQTNNRPGWSDCARSNPVKYLYNLLSSAGSINFSELGQAARPPLLFTDDIGDYARPPSRVEGEATSREYAPPPRREYSQPPRYGQPPVRQEEAGKKWADKMMEREYMAAPPRLSETSVKENKAAQKWADKMMAREYGETPQRKPTNRVEEDKEDDQKLDSWASKMLEREFGGVTERSHKHPPMREYDHTVRRLQVEEEQGDFEAPVIPVNSVKKYAKPPMREFSSPPREFSDAPRKFSRPPRPTKPTTRPTRTTLTPARSKQQNSITFGEFAIGLLSL